MSLRISTMVERCHDTPEGKVRVRHGKKCVIVEDLVLHRWRHRSRSAKDGELFDGCRLRPNTWRVIRLATESGLSLTKPITRDDLADAVALVQDSHPTLKATPVDKLTRVMNYLQSRGVLEVVVNRDRPTANPGLPDLFLWRDNGSGTVRGGQFIEVKRQTLKPRWREPLSKGQKSELAFLTSLGLSARAVWLTETATKPGPTARV